MSINTFQNCKSKRLWLTVIVVALSFLHSVGQTADDQFMQPLSTVIKDIEQKFHVAIRIPKELLQDKYVTYAGWRFRPELEQTLTNVLSSLDLTFAKEGEGKYKVQTYQYHLKTPSEGLLQLKELARLYNDKSTWEKRSTDLRACILSTLQLNKFPKELQSKPYLTKLRTYTDYTVQDFALETLPGVYAVGTIYRPKKSKGKLPVVLNPDGHFSRGRFREDCQYRTATQARLGAIAVSYELYAWEGESLLQVDPSAHRKSYVQILQVLNATRILDYVLSFADADTSRVAITGASGGGSQTMLMAAIDPRITLSIPVVMMSSYHSGGCPCESGMGIHLCSGGTNNVEIAAMAAPKPQLLITDGKDWTQFVPVNEFPFIKRIYGFYGEKAIVENAHFGEEGHDYGASKRQAMYAFLIRHFGLNDKMLKDENGKIKEDGVTIEKDEEMKVWGADGKGLPVSALLGWDNIEKMLKGYISK